jgi:hypothetical protein
VNLPHREEERKTQPAYEGRGGRKAGARSIEHMRGGKKNTARI